MIVDTNKYSDKIRKLCWEYYCRNITQTAYLIQRKIIFEEIEDEMYGVTMKNDSRRV